MLDQLAERVNADANLVRRGRHVDTTFMLAIDDAYHLIRVAEGRIVSIKPARSSRRTIRSRCAPRATPGRSFGRRSRSPVSPTSSRW
jgi:hypothetical protein